MKSWGIRKAFRSKSKTWQRKGRLVWLQKWVPRLLKHSVLALWREPLALHGQAIFLKSCTVQRRKCKGSRNKALLSHKLLTSFIPLSPYHYTHCPDMVQCLDISFSRVQIVKAEKGNPRVLVAIAFVMTSCTSDESKHLRNSFGKEFPKNCAHISLFWGPCTNYLFINLFKCQVHFFKSSCRLSFYIMGKQVYACKLNVDLSISLFNGNIFYKFGKITHWGDRWLEGVGKVVF